jgi:hypothetical protein
MVFALAAELSKGRERRSPVRRRLRFDSTLSASGRPAKAVVLDLSEAGLMLHTQAMLTIDERFEVDLSVAGPDAVDTAEARVVWKRGALYGCRFVPPVSRATISTLLLRAPAPSREG